MNTIKNTAVSVIRGCQVQYGVNELTVFAPEEDDPDTLMVCYSGALDSFNDSKNLDMFMTLFRRRILNGNVDRKIVFHNKLFIWLADPVAVK